MGVVVYKCAKCGAALSFSAKTGRFNCEYCLSSFNEQELKVFLESQLGTQSAAGNENLQDEILGQTSEIKPESFVDASESNRNDSGECKAVEYNCSECGASLITDENTAATSCAFCHSPTIIPTRLSGEFKPSKVIPFEVDRKSAAASFMTYLKGRPFLPRDFKTVAKRDNLTGIYAPFWLFDSKTDVDMTAEGQNIRSYRSGDYLVTETDHYAVERKVDMVFDDIPADASVKLDNKLMNLIEPYDYSKMVDFSMAYLSGFLAEKYDEDSDAVFPRIEQRLREYGIALTRDTITGYTSVVSVCANVECSDISSNYALLPVWMMNYKYKDREYTFAINGQTGRMVGKLPVSIPKMLITFGAVAIVAFLILFFSGGLS